MMKKNIIIICGVLLVCCACSNKKATGGMENGEKETEITVGSRKIKTKKFTRQGTAVVPMWNAQMATTEIRNGAGFTPLTSAEHASVWQPATKEDGAYNHYACLIYYDGLFYAMWGNHTLGEDAPGQRVLYSSTANWKEWSEPRELFAAPGPVLPRTEDGIHFKPDRWAIVDNELYAVVYVHGAGRYPIARKIETDGTIGDPFLVESVPANGSLPDYMQGTQNTLLPIATKISNWYKENGHISWWADAAKGVQRTAIDGASLIESFMYKTKDGEDVVMLRNWGTSANPVHNNRMYVSFKKGAGGWGKLYPTDIPDAPSRAQAITLPDGRIVLIGNQNVPRFDAALYLDRDPMTLSVSNDGYVFDKVYSYRTGSPTTYRIAGVGGRNPGFAYSSSIVQGEYLYTLYSIGKEDMAISRVALSEIR
ncbi:MAG: exo-alpha-sialidase [Chitinophagaceae bacterium]|nr:exo-alpha-sialidase [Chitinophagaceae bacterium]